MRRSWVLVSLICLGFSVSAYAGRFDPCVVYVPPAGTVYDAVCLKDNSGLKEAIQAGKDFTQGPPNGIFTPLEVAIVDSNSDAIAILAEAYRDSGTAIPSDTLQSAAKNLRISDFQKILDASLKLEKNFLMLLRQTAAGVDGPLKIKALQEYETRFYGEDPSG